MSSTPFHLPELDRPDRDDYLRTLLTALHVHSPDTLSNALLFLHLTGLFLPMIDVLLGYNDWVIEHGRTPDIDRLEILLKDTSHYVQHRLHLVERTARPNFFEAYITNPLHPLTKRQDLEQVYGLLVSIRILARQGAWSLAARLADGAAAINDPFLLSLWQQLTTALQTGDSKNIERALQEVERSLKTDFAKFTDGA